MKEDLEQSRAEDGDAQELKEEIATLQNILSTNDHVYQQMAEEIIE